MTMQSDPDAILAAWLDEGPLDLPDVTRRAILTAVPTTAQTRPRLLVRRPLRVGMLPAFVLAAAVALVVVGSLAFVASRPNVPMPSPSPSLSSSAPSPDAWNWRSGAWLRSGSRIHGYRASVPRRWTSEFAQEPATPDDVIERREDRFDRYAFDANTPTIRVVSTRLTAGLTDEGWLARYRAARVVGLGGPCVPEPSTWQPITVHNHPAGLYVGCGMAEVMDLTEGFAYVFSVEPPVGGTLDEARELLERFVSTVEIDVTLAELAPGTYTTLTSGPSVTFTVPSGWQDYGGGVSLNIGSFDHGNNPVGGIAVWPEVRAAASAPGCAVGAAPGVGRDSSSIIAALSANRALQVGEPSSVRVGQLQGTAVDVSVKPGTNLTCRTDTVSRGVPLLFIPETNARAFAIGAAPLEVVLVDLGTGKTAGILVESGPELIPEAMRVVESIRFGP